uniref:Uncharacterized protein MANES_03G053300 n=1 Tax=Rhizophora mucronata TaxID=61149 RepID=A0A2P2J4K6_RHIMU
MAAVMNEEPPTGNSRSSTASAPNVVPNFALVSSLIVQSPMLLLRAMTKPNDNIGGSPLPPPGRRRLLLLRELHKSIASTADKCLCFLHSLASDSANHPVLKKILCSSSEFTRRLTQVRCGGNDFRNTCSLSKHNFAAVLPGDSVAGIVVANGILNFLNIYNTLLVVRLVLTWFPNSPPAIVSPLSTLCDPYLNIFRGIIPPLGGTLDLSPILAFLVLNAFTSTAAALPAELPGQAASQGRRPSHPLFTDMTTTSQRKWMRRLSGNRSKSCTGTD